MSSFRRASFACACVAVAMLTMSCAQQSGGTDADPAAQTLPMQELTVTAADKSTEVSEPTIEARPVEVTVVNETSRRYHVAFARLNEGVSLDEVEKKIQSEKVLELITVSGSTEDAAKRGGEESIVVEFPPGQYIALDPEAGTPFAPFEVVPASEGEAETPTADYEIAAGEFYFEIPDGIEPGPATFALTNAGEQSHEMSISRKGDSEDEGHFVLAPAPGGTLWAEFDLKPGEYTAVCFFPDPKSGKPHVKLGMKTKFTVK